MEILEEKDGVDTELLVYAMTLINKVGLPSFLSLCLHIFLSLHFTRISLSSISFTLSTSLSLDFTSISTSLSNDDICVCVSDSSGPA